MLRLLLAVICGAGLYAPPHEKPLLVSAAISLSDALGEVARAYTAAGGGPVEFNFAGSNVLARQIINGAPADLFISADEAQMNLAQQRGGIDAGTRVALLANRLAVVTPSGRHDDVRDVRALLQPAIKRIATGDPAAVPAGAYTKQYLERAGLWDQMQPKLLPLANVRAALAAVESAGADVAFVYESDAAVSTRVRLAFVVSGPDAPRIIYPAALTAACRAPVEARRFLAFLQGPEATRIFARHKFSRPVLSERQRVEG